MRVSDLSLGERLLLDRRRVGESQKQAAERWGVTLYRYRKAEKGYLTSHEVIKPAIKRLKAYEACYIQRLRMDISVTDMASDLGVSEWWVIQMEHGSVDSGKLVRHWAA